MRISDWSSDVCSSDLILAHGLADTEEGVAAAEEVGGFTVHFFVFPFGCGHRPLPMRTASQRPCQFLQSLEFPGFFPFSPRLAAILFVNRFPSNGKCHHFDRKSVVWVKSVSVGLDSGCTTKFK